MYRYIRCYKTGYIDGYNDAKNDVLNHKKKKFTEIDTFTLLAKLYDIGYIEGYNNYLKNNTFK